MLRLPYLEDHLSSDKKLIGELQKLSDDPWAGEQEKACKQKKKLKQIEKDMKGDHNRKPPFPDGREAFLHRSDEVIGND